MLQCSRCALASGSFALLDLALAFEKPSKHLGKLSGALLKPGHVTVQLPPEAEIVKDYLLHLLNAYNRSFYEHEPISTTRGPQRCRGFTLEHGIQQRRTGATMWLT